MMRSFAPASTLLKTKGRGAHVPFIVDVTLHDRCHTHCAQTADKNPGKPRKNADCGHPGCTLDDQPPSCDLPLIKSRPGQTRSKQKRRAAILTKLDLGTLKWPGTRASPEEVQNPGWRWLGSLRIAPSDLAGHPALARILSCVECALLVL